MHNSKTYDSGGKLAFENPTLCSQLLNDYSNIDILKSVRSEDIEDVTERFIPLFTEERNADVVKKVHLPDGEDLFVLSLIEHKSDVDFDVVMQMYRYMTFIWEDFASRLRRRTRALLRLKFFAIRQYSRSFITKEPESGRLSKTSKNAFFLMTSSGSISRILNICWSTFAVTVQTRS